MYLGVMTGDYQVYGDESPTGERLQGLDVGDWVLVLDPKLVFYPDTFPPVTPPPNIPGLTGPVFSYLPPGGNPEFQSVSYGIAENVNPATQVVGFLLYTGGFDTSVFDSDANAYEALNAPKPGDLFLLRPTKTGDLFTFTEALTGPSFFDVTVEQDLVHQGPYTPVGCTGPNDNWLLCAYEGRYQLDTGRDSVCTGSQNPCVISQASSVATSAVVPVPAAFPLFGSALGLLALLGYRRRMAAG
jgi:hypothetical protein